MDNRIVREYANFLDYKTKHKHFAFSKNLEKAIKKASSVIQLPIMEFRLTGEGVTANSLENDTNAMLRLHHLVEYHCIEGLELALITFGATASRSVLVMDKDSTRTNHAPLAHWEVWYDHGKVLNCLFRNQCVDLGAVGTGRGWSVGRGTWKLSLLKLKRYRGLQLRVHKPHV